jgi:hypothetical protein
MDYPYSGRRGSSLPILVFGGCLVVYLVLYLFVPAGKGVATKTIGDEPHYLIIAESILHDGDLTLADEYASGEYRRDGYYSAASLQPQVTLGRNGWVVPWHQVLPALVILPGFAAAGWRGAGVTMILLMGAAALFTFLILRMFVREATAAIVTLFFFLTYPLLLYSHLIYPEVLAIFLLALGTWSALAVRSGRGPGFLLIAGIAAALLPHAHAKFLVLSAALALLVVLCARQRGLQLLYFFVPLAISLAALLLWTYYLYGPNIAHGLTVTSGPGGFFGGDSPWGIFGLYFDRAWGLLPFAPLYLALFAGIPLARTRRAASSWYLYIPVTVVAYTIVVGAFREWHGGAAPVPRYLVPLIPLFVLCAGIVAAGVKRLYAWIVLGALAAAQLVLTVFARIFPAATLGLPHARNELYHYIFGNGFVSAELDRIFPLFHPVTPRSLAVMLAWAVLVAFLVYARRFYMGSAPGETLICDGDKPVYLHHRAGHDQSLINAKKRV